MASLTEAQCRAICERLDVDPNSLLPIPDDWDRIAAWKAVQRAAEEGGRDG